MNPTQRLSLIGGIMALFGTIVPYEHTFLGDVVLISAGPVAFFAVGAGVFAIYGGISDNRAVRAISAVLLTLISFAYLVAGISQKLKYEQQVSGNPLRGLSDPLERASHLTIGWWLLSASAVCLIVAAIKSSNDKKTNGGQKAPILPN